MASNEPALPSGDGNNPVGGRAPLLLGVQWSLLLLGTALIVLRCIYARQSASGRLRWDWLWVMIAWAFATAGALTQTWGVANGLGNHTGRLNVPQRTASLKGLYLTLYIGLGGLAVAKLSIVAYLLDILAVQSPQAKKRRYGLWAVGIINFVVTVILIGALIGACSPVDKAWNLSAPDDCDMLDAAAKFGNFQAAVGALADFILALWPITIVWNLKVSISTKISCCLLMALGILPGVASIARAATVPSNIKELSDPTYQLTPYLYWGTTELWAIIILGSLPPLRPLFMRIVRGKKATQEAASGDPARPGNTSSLPTPQMVQTRDEVPAAVARAGSLRYTPVIVNQAGNEEYVLSPHSDAPLGAASRTTSIMSLGEFIIEDEDETPRESFDEDATPISLVKNPWGEKKGKKGGEV